MGPCASRTADKKLKPATHVKVRHILCEKQSKVRMHPCGCAARTVPYNEVCLYLHTPHMQASEALAKVKAGEQFATVSNHPLMPLQQ